MGEYRNIDINAWTKVGEGGNGSLFFAFHIRRHVKTYYL